LIIADGEAISLSKLQELATDKTVMVLDGAYHQIHDTGMRIDYLLGDFDSITPELLKAARDQGTEVIHTPDQDFTDLEKAIQYCQNNDMQEIDIAAATGLRLDHTLYNLQLLSRYHRQQDAIRLHTETEVCFVMQNETRLYPANKGDGFAIFGAPTCVVTTKGLRYNLNNTILSYDVANSACNHVVDDIVSLEVEGTALLMHRNQ